MISGYLAVRDGIDLDFCFSEAIDSLLPICDEVVVGDFGSEDGTLDELVERSVKGRWDNINFRDNPDHKIRVITKDRTEIVRDIDWWVNILNWVRGELKYENQLTLDADEVLDERAYPLIEQAAKDGRALWFRRNNYWRDLQHLAPSGTVCGDAVVRFGPSDLPMVSDEPHPEGEPAIQQLAGSREFIPEELTIHHLGFLRRQPALIAKCEINLRAFFGADQDVRLIEAQEKGIPWQDACPFDKPLQDYDGPYPAVAHQWLKERGYNV